MIEQRHKQASLHCYVAVWVRGKVKRIVRLSGTWRNVLCIPRRSRSMFLGTDAFRPGKLTKLRQFSDQCLPACGGFCSSVVCGI